MTYTNRLRIIFTLVLGVAIMFQYSCDKGDDPESDIPYANINVVINPNSTLYQELNVVGGWMYYNYVNPPSRGLIVYRLSQEEFKAFERTPPSNSNYCYNDATGEYTRLLVDDYYPFIFDTCSEYTYQILDGSPFSPATVPLKQYHTAYDGMNLYITN